MDELKRPDIDMDGITHLNTHSKTKKPLGNILSLPFETGSPIHHPLLGHFRSVENAWWYLNTGGNRDRIRSMEPGQARQIARLSDSYNCDKFRELIRDITILKLQTRPEWVDLMTSNELPFDHYFIKGRGIERFAVRPKHCAIYVGILDEVRDILRGEKDHEWVMFSQMNFTKRKMRT